MPDRPTEPQPTRSPTVSKPEQPRTLAALPAQIRHLLALARRAVRRPPRPQEFLQLSRPDGTPPLLVPMPPGGYYTFDTTDPDTMWLIVFHQTGREYSRIRLSLISKPSAAQPLPVDEAAKSNPPQHT